jgi:hypothetical protein
VAVDAPVNGTEDGAAGRVICTVGMHRSGTSLVSRMLNLLGVHLGPDERLSGTGEDNRKGYWEHRAFVEINDEILARFGGRWDEPPAFSPAWPGDPRLLDLREKAGRLLAEDFAAAPLWGWKDPRTCLTLPFWQEVVGPMRYVMCIRNPRAVVASLTRRNGMSADQAQQLWLAHLQAGLAHTSGHPRMFVFYEDIIDDWRLALRSMAAFIGDPERGEDVRVHEAVGQFIDNEMCHHRGSLEDLAGDQRIAFPTTGLYLALRGHGAGRSTERTLDLIGARALETWDRTAAMDAERDHLARVNGEQSAAIIALNAALQEIHTSRAWRLVLFYRRVVVHLLPAGTRRRRAGLPTA